MSEDRGVCQRYISPELLSCDVCRWPSGVLWQWRLHSPIQFDELGANLESTANHTKTPVLQHSSRTSACTTSFIVAGSVLESIVDWDPVHLAICRRFRLLSKPIMGEEGPGSGRYFPFPVPESNPRCPGGTESRNLAMIGQGFCWVSVSASRGGARIPYIS